MGSLLLVSPFLAIIGMGAYAIYESIRDEGWD